MTVELITPREVPLGGQRAMTVRRTLPTRERSLIGAWCFLDHYGPDEVADTGGMSVAPHPHTGLQTVSWLFTGEIEHRDSAGHHAMVRPGRAQPDDRRPRHQPLRGLDARRPRRCTAPSSGSRCRRRRATARPPSSTTRRRRSAVTGWTGRVFLGSLLGETSPVTTFTPAARRRARCSSRAPALELDVDPALRARRARRHRGRARVDGVEVAQARARLRRRSARTVVDAAGGTGGRAPAAARRPAVRRADRDVVELRRPHPRGGRRVPRRLAGPARGRDVGPHSATAASASRSATRCRRSRRRRCRTCGSRNVTEPKDPAPRRRRSATSVASE